MVELRKTRCRCWCLHNEQPSVHSSVDNQWHGLWKLVLGKAVLNLKPDRCIIRPLCCSRTLLAPERRDAALVSCVSRDVQFFLNIDVEFWNIIQLFSKINCIVDNVNTLGNIVSTTLTIPFRPGLIYTILRQMWSQFVLTEKYLPFWLLTNSQTLAQ